MTDDNPFDELNLEDAIAVEALMGWDGVTCTSCGSPLGLAPEEEHKDAGGLPVCPECHGALTSKVVRGT